MLCRNQTAAIPLSYPQNNNTVRQQPCVFFGHLGILRESLPADGVTYLRLHCHVDQCITIIAGFPVNGIIAAKPAQARPRVPLLWAELINSMLPRVPEAPSGKSPGLSNPDVLLAHGEQKTPSGLFSLFITLLTEHRCPKAAIVNPILVALADLPCQRQVRKPPQSPCPYQVVPRALVPSLIRRKSRTGRHYSAATKALEEIAVGHTTHQYAEDTETWSQMFPYY